MRGAPGPNVRASIAQAARKNETTASWMREPSIHQSSEDIEASPNAGSITEMLARPRLTIRPPEPVNRFQPASPAATVADHGAALNKSLPGLFPKPLQKPLQKIVESKGAEAAVQFLPRKDDEEPPRPSPELQKRSVIHEQIVVEEILRRSESEPQVAEADSTERPAVTSPIIAQPRITPFFADRSGERDERRDESAAPPAPTIHVTIGRVEVRATQSASPSSPKSRPTRPAMSLDDYLRRRGSGGVG